MLEGLLHVCSHCKKMREKEGSWKPMEQFISDKTDAVFSHGICPDCAQEHYGHITDPAQS